MVITNNTQLIKYFQYYEQTSYLNFWKTYKFSTAKGFKNMVRKNIHQNTICWQVTKAGGGHFATFIGFDSGPYQWDVLLDVSSLTRSIKNINQTDS